MSAREPRLPARALLLNAAATTVALVLTVFLTGGELHNADDLVLVATGGHVAWLALRANAGREAAAARPWRWLVGAAFLLPLACLLTGSGLTAPFGSVGIGDPVLLLAAACPLVTCFLVSSQTARTTSRPLLLVDGVILLTALIVVAGAYVIEPTLSGGRVTHDAEPLVLVYAVYAAVAAGVASALLVAATSSVRRSATLLNSMVLLQAAAAASLAMSVDRRSTPWQLVADVALTLSLYLGVAAIAAAPDRTGPREETQVGWVGLAVTAAALVGLPVALVVSQLRGAELTSTTVIGTAVVMLLLVGRTAGRVGDNQRLSRDLSASEDEFRQLVQTSSDGVAIIGAGAELLFVSPTGRTMLGLPATAGDDTPLLPLVHPDDRDGLAAQLTADLATGAPTVHFRLEPVGGGPVTELEATVSERPHSPRRVLHLRDVTDRRSRERELEQMAFTDHLTQLPNRAALHAALAAPAPDGPRCLLLVDLDGFKAVNDTAGHEAGDHLLVEVGRRLRAVVRTGDLVTRLGGDEFALLLGGTEAEAVEIAQRVVEVLSLPHQAAGTTFAVGASVGVTVLRAGAGQVALREADDALRAAKQAGKGRLRVWAGTDAADVGDLRAALDAGALELRYDVVEAVRGRNRLVTAHPVWPQPGGTEVPGGELWAAAERQGCSADLSRWLVGRALADTAPLPAHVCVALELTAGQLRTAAVEDEVAGACAASGLPPERVVLSVSEEVLLTAPASVPAMLRRLAATGVRLALEDYGLGQTLLAHLQRVPLSGLRVHLPALARGQGALRAAKALAAVVALGAVCDVLVLASGVDDEATLEMARASGVSAVTGAVVPHDLTADQVRAVLGGGSRVPVP